METALCQVERKRAENNIRLHLGVEGKLGSIISLDEDKSQSKLSTPLPVNITRFARVILNDCTDSLGKKGENDCRET